MTQNARSTSPAIPADTTTRERCAMCHDYSPVGFHVPDAIWRASVHPHWQASILCIVCFARGADERGIAWDRDIEFFPVSFATHVEIKAKSTPHLQRLKVLRADVLEDIQALVDAGMPDPFVDGELSARHRAEYESLSFFIDQLDRTLRVLDRGQTR